MVRLVTRVGFLLVYIKVIEAKLTEAYKPNERETVDDSVLRYSYLIPFNGAAGTGGVEAHWREFAHLGAIGWMQDNGTIQWGCGGSLIWENFVLTAAHCVLNPHGMKKSNELPTVVRFGDLNLFNATDDKFAQQYRIVKIIRHPKHKFNSKYHDIALFKLEKKIKLHDTVVPACLWDDEEVRFTTLESAGWGQTGFEKPQSPTLLKVTLEPVEKSECIRHYSARNYGLKQGLQDYHLCAGATKMDTCRGDSGGPLQVKLLHNVRITPFIVALTSFGSTCGQSVPGVYTMVAPYIPWIRSVIAEHGEDAADWKFKPYACALRYVSFRIFDPATTGGRYEANGKVRILFNEAHFTWFFGYIPTTVSIGWGSRSDTVNNCYGVLIDHKTVLTLAQCASLNGKPPSYIALKNQKFSFNLTTEIKEIEDIFVHPEYTPGSVYNNIAVLKLQTYFKFHRFFLPAFIRFVDLPSELQSVGRGRADLNFYRNRNILEQEGFDRSVIDLFFKVTHRTADNCRMPKKYQPLLTKGLAEEHLCFGKDMFLVPGVCELKAGGAVYDKRFYEELHTVYALNLLGRDCGYGESAVAVKISSHKEWLSEVLLEHRRRDVDSAQFFDTDLAIGDHCRMPNGNTGMCTDVRRCPKVQYEFKTQKQVTFCGNGSIACCPFHNILNATDGAGSELHACSTNSKSFHKKSFLPHMIKFQSTISNTTTKSCIGTLITRSVAVASASCLSRIDINLAVVILNWRKKSRRMLIKKIILHPEFEAATQQNDIALVTMDGTVNAKSGKIPACVWQNQTHIPSLVKDGIKGTFLYPRYGEDCKDFGIYLEPTQFCADVHIQQRDRTTESGTPTFWQKKLGKRRTYRNYLAGIVTDSTEEMTVQTRIESYVDWIKSNL